MASVELVMLQQEAFMYCTMQGMMHAILITRTNAAQNTLHW